MIGKRLRFCSVTSETVRVFVGRTPGLPEEKGCLQGQKDALSSSWIGKDLEEDPMLKIHCGGAFSASELH